MFIEKVSVILIETLRSLDEYVHLYSHVSMCVRVRMHFCSDFFLFLFELIYPQFGSTVDDLCGAVFIFKLCSPFFCLL